MEKRAPWPDDYKPPVTTIKQHDPKSSKTVVSGKDYAGMIPCCIIASVVAGLSTHLLSYPLAYIHYLATETILSLTHLIYMFLIVITFTTLWWCVLYAVCSMVVPSANLPMRRYASDAGDLVLKTATMCIVWAFKAIVSIRTPTTHSAD